MKTDKDLLPVCGSNSKELGVRVAPNENADIDVTESSTVNLNGRGMSVAQNWRALPGHLIPKRLISVFPGATGSNSLSCFRIGDGPFVNSSLNADLTLALKAGRTSMGNLVPATDMSVETFQAALAATREQWRIDET
ncbi:MAG: hypothetical protein JNL58_25405 [Planctomyces sp.]|nr:hypothetical protein [Planctomyces sp.]